jgi:hypothetical protein
MIPTLNGDGLHRVYQYWYQKSWDYQPVKFQEPDDTLI